MKNSNGITIVALIITIIVTLILVTVVVKYGTSEIDKAKIEDLKATMLLIKGRAQIVVDKEAFGESYDNTGMLAYGDATTYTANITSDLQEVLTTAGTENMYIWTQDAMNNNNINVEITSEDFYIINYTTLEVYYSLGYTVDENTYYSLTQLQGL